MTAKARARGCWSALILSLGFTLPITAWADDAQPEGRPSHYEWIEDPYQPHDARGTNLRAGSAVGYVFHDAERYTALGPTASLGHRFDRLTIEATYLYADLSEPGPSTRSHGRMQRLGVMGRVDALRFGPHAVGANSMLALYVEAGLAQQRYHWYRPEPNERPRAIPVDDNRVTAVAGFGFNLDHRLEQPRGFPSRIGWQLGWQLTAADRQEMGPTIECRGQTCVAGPVVMRGAARDTSLLVTSTIAVTW